MYSRPTSLSFFSMSSVTSHIELKKYYCVIIVVGDGLKCKIKTGVDYLEQSGNESTLQEYCVRSSSRCNSATSRDDVERSVGSWMKLLYRVVHEDLPHFEGALCGL